MITDIEIKNQLNLIGYEINDIYDLVNTKNDYSTAIPLLIRFLKEGVLNKSTEEGIIRSLAVKSAKGKAGKDLITYYKKINNPSESLIGWTIGNTIYEIITKDIIEDVISIALDKKNGFSREMFVLSLGKFNLKSTEKILIKLLNDPMVAAHAIKALGMINSINCFEAVKKLTNSSNLLIKKNAKKFLEKCKK